MPELTIARLRKLLEYNPETGVFRWKINMPPRGRAGAVAGTIAVSGHQFIGINGGRYLAHRLAWFYVHGKWPRCGIDHKDGQPDHNWIDNLREATQAQNCANTAPHCDSATGLKGVSQKRKKWEARIMVRGTVHRLGVFDTPQAAHAAYAVAAVSFHGEFARAE